MVSYVKYFRRFADKSPSQASTIASSKQSKRTSCQGPIEESGDSLIGDGDHCSRLEHLVQKRKVSSKTVTTQCEEEKTYDGLQPAKSVANGQETTDHDLCSRGWAEDDDFLFGDMDEEGFDHGFFDDEDEDALPTLSEIAFSGVFGLMLEDAVNAMHDCDTRQHLGGELERISETSHENTTMSLS